ncbi:hypothetical protein CPC79_28445, partial [Salmonella enterica]|nr:hypothetical protein [Salmonella enterica]
TDRLSAFGNDIWVLALEITDTRFVGEREALEKYRLETETARAEATALADQFASELEEFRGLIRSLHEQLTAAGKETASVGHEQDEAQREVFTAQGMRGELQAVTLCRQEIVTAIKQKTSPIQ